MTSITTRCSHFRTPSVHTTGASLFTVAITHETTCNPHAWPGSAPETGALCVSAPGATHGVTGPPGIAATGRCRGGCAPPQCRPDCMPWCGKPLNLVCGAPKDTEETGDCNNSRATPDCGWGMLLDAKPVVLATVAASAGRNMPQQRQWSRLRKTWSPHEGHTQSPTRGIS